MPSGWDKKMEKTKDTTQIKEFDLFGKKLRYNSCSSHNCRVSSIKFTNLRMCKVDSKPYDNIIFLSEIEILSLINEAVSLKIYLDNKEKGLFITTKDYKICVFMDVKK